MHQQARPPPRVSSPASSPQTNPSRTNNPREGVPPERTRAGSGASSREAAAVPTTEPLSPAPASEPSAESFKKLDQIIQNFHTKAAAVILEARMNLTSTPPAKGSSTKRINKWFQLDTEDFENFKDQLRTWRSCSVLDEKHQPPLILETYLDATQIKPGHSLVVSDDDGKRWDVMEALNAAGSSDNSPGRVGQPTTEVILERWRIELKMDSTEGLDDFGVILPTIYKKIIVFFRSLFTTARVLPAWKVAQSAMNKTVPTAIRPLCRIWAGEPETSGVDRLRQPLYDTRADVVTDYIFSDLEVPVGRLGASVTYRNDNNFRVDSSESLLSSQLIGVEENFFKPSMPQRIGTRRQEHVEVGSLPSHRRDRDPRDVQQTYGSLSTFHGENALATSPITALRTVRPPGSDTSSPPGSVPHSIEPNPPNSLPVTAAKPTMRGYNSGVRRPSVSFQPFKAGSLSASPVPRTLDSESPASPSSIARAAGIAGLTQPRNRSSLTAGMPASLRGGPPLEVPMGSPRPASTSRYSSSFTHRKGRLSFGGASRAGDDEQGSSGRGSLASSLAQPGSGLLAEVGGHTSSGSLQTDDDQISEFLKALDSKKTLKSFESSKRGESATNKTVAQLSKFHAMRDSNNALTESMTSSLQLNRSSSTSSRQLSNVPGMAAPASVSVSSSPGKPLSPHTPHTPAVPSRLSENSIARYNSGQTRGSERSGNMRETLSREDTVTQDGTTAIDIPISPRLGTHQRRSSSVAQQNRAMIEDDDGEITYGGNRSISLGAEGGEAPTRSMLLGRHGDEGEASAANEESPLQPPGETQSIGSAEVHPGSSDSSKPPGGLISAPSSSPFGRRRYAGMAAPTSTGGRGQTPPHSSRGSFTGSINRFDRGENSGNNNVDDEPLLFDMSEMDAQGRRSLEEGRGSGSAGAGSANRNEYEPRGISRRGWS